MQHNMDSPEQSKYLLLGLLAFQNGFVTREQLFAAFGAWLSDKSKSLSDYLIDQKALKSDDLEILLRLVDKHMQSHENDLEKSLAGAKPSTDVLGALHTLAMSHPELEQSLVPLSIPTRKIANPAFERSPSDPVDPTQPRQIGNYRLLQKLGEGGMGTVWMAEQEKPVRRRVALKLIKAGIDNEQIIARFEAERQALSMMDHVNIARVLDAGTTDSGQPYFVMELVQGIPLTEYCDKHRLSLRDRLELFIPVCQAVQHAHQKGIIHRDLKPSNVLVTLYDGKPVPKVIDFGLAKALQHQTKLTDKTMFTEFGQVVGTLQYMSPEQAEMNALDIDTRSDIYSLGVMLYELLTGSTPIEKEAMRNEAIFKVLQSIREVEPQRPSARLSSTTQVAVSCISDQRRIDPKKLQSILRGELDWIVMKSLEKNRARRYATAVDLAEDIERHLNGDPIQARPPSVRYKLGKFVRKNSGLVSLTVLASSLLGAGIVGTSWFAIEFRKMRLGQIATSVEGLQNNLGASVPFNLEKLRSLPSELVLPELQTRFDSATNPRHKLSLTFGLAHFGRLDSDYLVSRIDDIDASDRASFVKAMKTNVPAAIESIKSESTKCVDKSMWRRKAKLAITALNLGDASLATDVCDFEDRPDPEQRTLFIDEFPRWESDFNTIYMSVDGSKSPALRSGICLAIAQIPVEMMSAADVERWSRLASRWFVEQRDTSTHSGSGLLLRRWGLPEPKGHDHNTIVSHRDWFVNSIDATLLKIHGPEIQVALSTDPLLSYRKRLEQLSKLNASEVDNPIHRRARAIASYQVGDMDSSLTDIDWLLERTSGKNKTELIQYKTLALARKGKADEAEEMLSKYCQLKPFPSSLVPYVTIQVPAWLGDFPSASQRLEAAVSDCSDRVDELYDIARAASLCCQAAEARGSDWARPFATRTFDILERLVRDGFAIGSENLSDFSNLRNDSRFVICLKELGTIGEFWLSDREVNQSQFELFANDSNYPATDKPDNLTEMISKMTYRRDGGVTSSDQHPANNVSWLDAVMFCNWLSLREGRGASYERTGATERDIRFVGSEEFGAWRLIPKSTGYRLPRDREWEYACRAMTTTYFSMGNDEELLRAYCQMFPSKQTAVCGYKLPNAWGLHDAYGNVWEWCNDKNGWSRILRGGSWDLDASKIYPWSNRTAATALYRTEYFGFRLALSPAGVSFPTEHERKEAVEPSVGASAVQRMENP